MNEIDESVRGGRYMDEQGRWHDAHGRFLDEAGNPLVPEPTQAEVELEKLKAFVAEKYPDIQVMILPGESFADAMIRLLDPALTPVEPPADPVEPPADPVEPPADPIEPPADPIEPPADPVDPPPPGDPVDPPAGQLDQVVAAKTTRTTKKSAIK